MTDKGKFGANKPPDTRGGQLDCGAVELWLAEAAEASLAPAIQQQLRDHAAGCPGCREKLDRARQGREWLQVLKQETLEPPVDMVARILAQTSLKSSAATEARNSADVAFPAREFPASAPSFQPRDRRSGQDGESAWRGNKSGKDAGKATNPADISVPVWQHNSVVVLRRTFFDPRLALVVAMAFFSITLTLNLMGVRLTNMHVADLQPQSLGRAFTRQYAEANASFARYYENLRIVYEVESRVRQIRRAAQTAPQSQPSNGKPRKRSSNSSGDSSHDQTASHRGGMAAGSDIRPGKNAATPQSVPDPKPVVTGPRMDASFRPQAAGATAVPQEERFVGWTWRVPPAISATGRTKFPKVLRDSSCASRMICISMHRFSTRERRLA